MSQFFKKMSFWLKLKATIALFGSGGELTLLITDAGKGWHVVMVAATLLSLAITQWFEDKDNNGIVDIFEEEKPTVPPTDSQEGA